VTLAFKNASIAAKLLTPPINWLNQINAQKDFKITIEGSEDLSNWVAQTIMLTQTLGLDMGNAMPDGSCLGHKIPADEAAKRLRNLTFFGYSAGTIVAQETRNAATGMMKKIGYTEEEANKMRKEAEKTVMELNSDNSLLLHENEMLKDALDASKAEFVQAHQANQALNTELEKIKHEMGSNSSTLQLERELRSRSEQKEREERNERIALSAQMVAMTKEHTQLEAHLRQTNELTMTRTQELVQEKQQNMGNHLLSLLKNTWRITRLKDLLTRSSHCFAALHLIGRKPAGSRVSRCRKATGGPSMSACQQAREPSSRETCRSSRKAFRLECRLSAIGSRPALLPGPCSSSPRLMRKSVAP
jgi:hypothetical protein